MRRRTLALLLVGAAACVLLAGLATSAVAASRSTPAFAPYQIPPQVPPPGSPAVRLLLRGSGVTADGSWIVVHLQGGPCQIGFQNGYLTAQSADYAIRSQIASGSGSRRRSERLAKRYVWPLVPQQYRQELRGIAAGLHAAGYPKDSLWDVVAANAVWDLNCYAALSGAQRGPTAALAAERRRKGGCSAFIATGSATTDGRPVMGHDTWFPYAYDFPADVMYYVKPTRGYEFAYQSFGGQIWSGMDWYENSAGLLLTETTLADSFYRPRGLPVFVRAREAAQYDATVAQAVRTLMHRSNGAYSNEWLIGDASGEIASLQLGGKVYDLHETHNGFYGSSNFDWGRKTRAEEAAANNGPDPYDPAISDYARYRRWKELRGLYFGRIDAQVGMTMLADTYDSYLKKQLPDLRDICGEPENDAAAGLPTNDGGVFGPVGDLDGKVCTEGMALDGLQSYACWGHPSGDHFDAAAFLAADPNLATYLGPFAVFGLRTFSADARDRWLRLTGEHWRPPGW